MDGIGRKGREVAEEGRDVGRVGIEVRKLRDGCVKKKNEIGGKFRRG